MEHAKSTIGEKTINSPVFSKVFWGS